MNFFNSTKTLTMIIERLHMSFDEFFSKLLFDWNILDAHGLKRFNDLKVICENYSQIPRDEINTDLVVAVPIVLPRVDTTKSIFSINMISYLFLCCYCVICKGRGNAKCCQDLLLHVIAKELDANIDANFITYISLQFANWLHLNGVKKIV